MTRLIEQGHDTTSREDGLSDRVRADVEALATMDRRTTSEGERRSAAWIAGSLERIGADDVRVTTFGTQSSWAPAHLAHVVGGLLAASFAGGLARLAATVVALSYELDVSGRSQWLRRWLPRRRGVSVTAKIRGSRGHAGRTLVLVAHHDAAHTGLVWHPRVIAANRSRSRRTDRTTPSHVVPLAGVAAAAMPGTAVRRVARYILGLSAALFLESSSSATAPGANDNATGVAAVFELARRLVRAPLPDTDVLLVFPGGEEAGNTGMRAWLRDARPQLDADTTLVVNIDALGSGEHLVVSRREGLTGWYAKEDVDLALEGAAAAGIGLRPVTFPNVSDAFIARHAGLRAISILSYEDGWVTNLHRPSDTSRNVRWNTVRDAVRLTEAIVDAWRMRPPA